MTLTGADVSHWQAGIVVADMDVQFLGIKATDGVGWIDPEAVSFWRAARAAGLRTLLYHFYEGDPVAEADYFVATVRPAVGLSVLALDFETHTSDVAGAKAFLDRVKDKTGITPLLYTSQSVAAAHDWSSVAAHYPLWVARYGSNSWGDVGAWDEPLMWQYTDAFHTAGYSVDGDYFYGSGADWDALASGSGGGGGDQEDDMPKYINQQTDKDWSFPADSDWRTVKITDDGGLSLLAGPVWATGVVSVTLEAPEAGMEVNLRVISVDTKSGETTKTVTGWPPHEFRTAGGQTQIVFPFSNHIGKSDTSGWSRKMRFQIKAWGGGTVKVLQSGARALYWE